MQTTTSSANIILFLPCQFVCFLFLTLPHIAMARNSSVMLNSSVKPVLPLFLILENVLSPSDKMLAIGIFVLFSDSLPQVLIMFLVCWEFLPLDIGFFFTFLFLSISITMQFFFCSPLHIVNYSHWSLNVEPALYT